MVQPPVGENSRYLSLSTTDPSPQIRPTVYMQGHLETSSDQPGDLGGPHPEQTSMKNGSEDRCSLLRSHSGRHRQGQKVPTPSRIQNVDATNAHFLSESVSKDAFSALDQQPDNVNFSSRSCPCRNSRVNDQALHRTDGQLLNRRRINFQSRVSTTTVQQLLFADGCVLNATTEKGMPRRIDLFYAACENLGLIINSEKPAVMHQPPPNTVHSAPRISVNGTHQQVVENFTYLGCTMSYSTTIDDEVVRQISNTSQAFGLPESQFRNATVFNSASFECGLNFSTSEGITVSESPECWTL
nr:unnamed protein product [Spirometra erinaceieuropaei]